MNIDLALSYFPVESPPKYLRRSNVSRSEFGMESVWCHRATSTRKDLVSQPSRLHSHRNFCFSSIRSSPRSVSTPRLHPLLDFHLAPINRCSTCDLTYFCSESTHLEVGFPLRCFQRLSAPHMATQRLPLAR